MKCFNCGEPGHPASMCPARVTPPRPQPASSGICLHCGMPGHQGCGRPVADYAAGAAEARAALGLSLTRRTTTPFREQHDMGPRSEEELRAEARRQVAEFRASRQVL